VSPHDLRQTPWHKYVRTLEISCAPLPNFLEPLSNELYCSHVNIKNVHFQKAEYENALIQHHEGLDVLAVMAMRRLEKANLFSFVCFY
jgi:hypothetical protein